VPQNKRRLQRHERSHVLRNEARCVVRSRTSRGNNSSVCEATCRANQDFATIHELRDWGSVFLHRYRASGILLHVTSLPSPYGIGDLGPVAISWIDRLQEAAQGWWQALFEVVNSITHDYQPYLGTITASPDASPKAAAIEAAYEVLSTFFPNSQATLYTDYVNSLGSIPDGPAKTDGIAVGHAAASAMVLLRANDGSSPRQFKVPRPGRPRRMAGDTKLSGCEWSRSRNRFSMAEHNSVQYPKRQRISAASDLKIGLMLPCSMRLPRQFRSSIRQPSKWHRNGDIR
jgi:hypothetical protein